MNAIEHAVALPPHEVIVHRAARRKILRQIAPLTTSAQDVHQAVHHRAHVGAALATARPRRRNQRRNNRPLLVREVAWVPQMITAVSRSVFLRPHRRPLSPTNQTASFESQMIPTTPEVLRRTPRPRRHTNQSPLRCMGASERSRNVQAHNPWTGQCSAPEYKSYLRERRSRPDEPPQPMVLSSDYIIKYPPAEPGALVYEPLKAAIGVADATPGTSGQATAEPRVPSYSY
jgi:hypothetical protein